MAPPGPTGSQQPALAVPGSADSALMRKEGSDKTKVLENHLDDADVPKEVGHPQETNLPNEAGHSRVTDAPKQAGNSRVIDAPKQAGNSRVTDAPKRAGSSRVTDAFKEAGHPWEKLDSTRQLESTRQNQPEPFNLSQKSIVINDDSDSGNDFARAFKPKRKGPSQGPSTLGDSTRELGRVQSKLDGDGNPSKRPKLVSPEYDQPVSPSRGVFAHGPANTPRASPSGATPPAHGNDPNHPKSGRNVRHGRPVTSKHWDEKQSKRAIPSNQPALPGLIQRKHNASQRNDGSLDPNRPPPTKAEHEASIGNRSYMAKPTQLGDANAALFKHFAAKQPPKPTTTLVNHFIDPSSPPLRKAGQETRLLSLTSMHKGSDKEAPGGTQSNTTKPTQVDDADEAWLTVGGLENPSKPASTIASRFPSSGSQRFPNNPVTKKAHNDGSRRLGIDTSNAGLNTRGSPDTATLTPSTPHVPIDYGLFSPTPARRSRKKVKSSPPVPKPIPAVPATEVFEKTQPIRAYTVFKMEQQVQTPSLDPDNRYTTVREVRMRSYTSAPKANRFAEEAMERNDSRVKSAVRGKQWIPSEGGPGEEGSFRGETVYANGHRHVFETREELVSLAELPKSLATRNGRKHPAVKPLLLDKEKAGVYRKRFDIFSVRAYSQDAQNPDSSQNVSYKVESHGAYTCYKMANKAALETFLDLAKPENSRVEDNLYYQYDILPNYTDSFQESTRKEDALVDMEWEPPVAPYKWPFVTMKVWVEESVLKGPVDIGDMVLGYDEAVVEGADEKGDEGADAGDVNEEG